MNAGDSDSVIIQWLNISHTVIILVTILCNLQKGDGIWVSRPIYFNCCNIP